jgi:hypothetical protein
MMITIVLIIEGVYLFFNLKNQHFKINMGKKNLLTIYAPNVWHILKKWAL